MFVNSARLQEKYPSDRVNTGLRISAIHSAKKAEKDFQCGVVSGLMVSARGGGRKNNMGGSSRLDLRLPSDHPIFAYPPRQRSLIAREWLDAGRDIERIAYKIAKQIFSEFLDQNDRTLAALIGQIQAINTTLEYVTTILTSTSREIDVIKNKQSTIIRDNQESIETAKDSDGDFKIPSEILNAFNNWGEEK